MSTTTFAIHVEYAEMQHIIDVGHDGQTLTAPSGSSSLSFRDGDQLHIIRGIGLDLVEETVSSRNKPLGHALLASESARSTRQTSGPVRTTVSPDANDGEGLSVAEDAG